MWPGHFRFDRVLLLGPVPKSIDKILPESSFRLLRAALGLFGQSRGQLVMGSVVSGKLQVLVQSGSIREG